MSFLSTPSTTTVAVSGFVVRAWSVAATSVRRISTSISRA
jgi:hypothetical protein